MSTWGSHFQFTMRQSLNWNAVITPPCPGKRNHLFSLWMEAAGSCSAIPQQSLNKKTTNQYFWLARLIMETVGFWNLRNLWRWIAIYCNICIEEGGRVDSHPSQADLVPPAGILKQHPIHHCQSSSDPKSLEFWSWLPTGGSPSSSPAGVMVHSVFPLLTLQPLPQIPGILWRFRKASECFS